MKCIGYSSPHPVTELQAVSGAPFYFINTIKCSQRPLHSNIILHQDRHYLTVTADQSAKPKRKH